MSILVKTEYGTIEVLRHEYDQQWFRYDRFTSNLTGEIGVDRLFCASGEDYSKQQSTTIGNGYDSRCSCCYLNIPHTEKAHQIRIPK